MSVELTTRKVRDVLVVEISGRLTVLDSTLRESMLHFLRTGYRRFILKMNEVSYIDSCGLGELIAIYVSIRNEDGELRLLTPGARVRELLRVTKLDTVFEILEDATPFEGSATSTARFSRTTA